ncbi:creatininase family protein [Galbitalea sp. SE-J8]|uniref:creatininase family protein n=1 Tax=Galbitalea sp. SE-J8 TaxID=3054952 RepID=UPI00259D1A2D|nr:creatininase family protein [Galbitalea sp. SE-J8]MDM4762121.1 creatininase family protein [Galbitalea sp. SE-J8]
MTGTPPTRELAHLPGPALASALSSGSIVVLPIGAIEHHGPHLPLSTDWLMADLVSTDVVAAAVEAGLDVWRLPAIAYGKSDEHFWAPGTMWVSWETLMREVVELGDAVAATPARTLVIYNGHGGNLALLQVALREIRKRTGLRTFLMGVSIKAAVDEPGGLDERGFGIHGGHEETSLVAYLRPDLVDLSKADRWVPDHLADLELVRFNGGPVQFGWLSNDFDDAGVIGDARFASAEHGAVVHERAVAHGVAALGEIARFRHRPDGPAPIEAALLDDAGGAR